jgi:hypothetical protein
VTILSLITRQAVALARQPPGISTGLVRYVNFVEWKELTRQYQEFTSPLLPPIDPDTIVAITIHGLEVRPREERT